MIRSDDAVRLRLDVVDLYAAYVDALDEGPIEAWPELFTDDCLYKIVARENWDHGLPLAAVLCESKGALQDRVDFLRQGQVFAPRTVRHVVDAPRIRTRDDATHAVEANFAVFESLLDEETRLLCAGRYHDVVVQDGNGLRFREKVCVFDSALVPTSLVYPL